MIAWRLASIFVLYFLMPSAEMCMLCISSSRCIYRVACTIFSKFLISFFKLLALFSPFSNFFSYAIIYAITLVTRGFATFNSFYVTFISFSSCVDVRTQSCRDLVHPTNSIFSWLTTFAEASSSSKTMKLRSYSWDKASFWRAASFYLTFNWSVKVVLVLVVSCWARFNSVFA